MAGNIVWNGGSVQLAMEKGQRKRNNKAASILKKALKAALSVPGRTVAYRTSKTGKVRKIYGAYGSAVSAAGDAPAKQHGDLYRSVRSKLQGKNVVRVLARGQIFEKGRSGGRGGKMAPRPFWQKTIAAQMSAIQAALSVPIVT